MKRNFINGAILCAIVLSLGTAAFAQRILGGYRTVSTTDKEAVAAADFAVGKKAEEQEGLTLVSIEKAETQSVAGRNFRLCLKVSLDEEEQQVKTVVHRNLKQEYSIISWRVEDCSEGESNRSEMSAGATDETPKSAAVKSSTVSAQCLGEQLSLRETEAEADMGGKRYGNFVFTNTSSNPCTLVGYPKFVLLNKAGQPLSSVKIEYSNDFVSGDTDENQSGDALSKVRLVSGKTAWFQIFYNDGMAIEHKKPFPVSAKVKVIAPNTARAFVLNSRIQACCGVQVSAVRAGLPQ